MLEMPSKKPMSQEEKPGMGVEVEIEPMEEEEMKPLSEYSVEELQAALEMKKKEAPEMPA